MKPIVAIIGTGYVGMQIAIVFAKAGLETIAYDNNKQRINELNQGFDKDYEVIGAQDLKILFTFELNALTKATCFIVTISTPINKFLTPDLHEIKNATKIIASLLKKNDIVVFESSVYPGTTEEILTPILEQSSGLKSGVDFYIGYSPERVVPGDKLHHLYNGVKIISGQNSQALKKITSLYKRLPIKLHMAPNIKVAEASKLLENIQRDVNIALMNEYAQVVNRMGISMWDVLDAAKTKWNFLPFNPGLVGGHCIPVDPYYFIYKANQYGFSSPLIRTAREVNEKFVDFIFNTLLKLLSTKFTSTKRAKVALLGMSFKPNVADTRHSLSMDLYNLSITYNLDIYAVDPFTNHLDFDLNWAELEALPKLDAIILAQAHAPFLMKGFNFFVGKLNKDGVFLDIPGAFGERNMESANFRYWSL